MRLFRRLLVLLAFAVASFVGGYASAHTVSGGSETDGWKTWSYGHLDTLVDTWVPNSINPCAQKYYDAITAGNDRWYAAYSPPRINYYQSTSSSNDVYCYNDPNDSMDARAFISSTKVNGDSVWFQIKFNTARSTTTENLTKLAMHELGHVIGLEDLYNLTNKPQVMYKYGDRAAYPSTKDKNGVNFIWGNP